MCLARLLVPTPPMANPSDSRPAAPESRSWVPNFVAILACQLFIFVSFAAVMPFLPLFLRELGEDERSAIAWTGLIHSSSAIALITVTPVWGALSDRLGRKPMVLRAMIGSASAFLLMGLATQAWHVLALRLLQGITSGTNAAVVALAAVLVAGAGGGVAVEWRRRLRAGGGW